MNTSVYCEFLSVAVSVVLAFVVCWAPFHAQRLMTTHVKEWTPQLRQFHSVLFHVAGEAAALHVHVYA